MSMPNAILMQGTTAARGLVVAHPRPDAIAPHFGQAGCGPCAGRVRGREAGLSFQR